MDQQPLRGPNPRVCFGFRNSKFEFGCARSGLAPLEMIIALPILLFVTALIVNFGTLATWRVRGEIVSRDAVWRARWPRTGDRESPPATWPANAAAGIADGPQLGVLEHPDLQHPVARGPLPNGFHVTGLLDPDRGYREGQASIVRRYPMLPRLGPYRSGSIEHPLLDQEWPCSEMGIPNVFRRTKPLYVLPTTEQSLPAALAAATQALFGMPNYTALYTLDRDGDIKRARGWYVDFHPRIRHPYPDGQLVDLKCCELDEEVVQNKEVERLVDTLDGQGRAQLHQISHRPRAMTDFFLEMYKSRIQDLESDLRGWDAELHTPRIPSERRRELRGLIDWGQAELDRIKAYTEPLEAYQARLDEIEAKLRRQVEAEGP